MDKNKMLQDIQAYNALWLDSSVLYREWAKAHDVSYFELLVILSLTEGPCSQKEICQKWQIPKQTVNSILKNFLQNNWVKLTPAKEDKRNKIILLTQEGRAYMEPLAQKLADCECTVWVKLGEERRKALMEGTALYNKFFREAQTDEES